MINYLQSYTTTRLEAKYEMKTRKTLNLCNRFLICHVKLLYELCFKVCNTKTYIRKITHNKTNLLHT